MTSTPSAARRSAAERLAPVRRPIVISAALTAAVLAAVAYAMLPPPSSRFADDFDRLDLTRWKYIDPRSPARVAVTGGALEIHLAPAPRGEVAFNGLYAKKLYDMRGRYWAAEVDASGLRQVPGVEMKFRVTQNHKDNYLSIEVAAGNIYYVRRYRGILNTDSARFDPVAQHWWRIRHGARNDLVFWETSPDGRHWKIQHMDICGFPMRKVVPELYAGTYAGIANPGVARFLTLRAGKVSPRPRVLGGWLGEAAPTLLHYVPGFIASPLRALAHKLL